MRLTLRTLLAYLDDVLEPAETREIGQKIRESPRAAALVSRIREAIRRRRLGAPDLEGPGQGLDPNLVAAYLDNELDPAQVVDLEQVCLDADMQLAEVAACHQILTLVLAEAREVPQANLDRYYALGPVPFDERLQVDGQATAAAKPPGPIALALDTAASNASRVPEYLKGSPWTQRVGPLAGIALIALVGFALLAMDRDLFRGMVNSGSGKSPLAQTDPVDNEAVPPDSTPSRPPSPNHGGAAPTTAAAPSTTVNGVASLPRGLDPAPPPDVPEPVPTVAATTPATTPATVPTTPSAPAATTTTTLPPAEPVAPVADRVRLPMQYTSTEGVLLRYEYGDRHWYVQPRRSEVHAEEIFACPEPFEAQLDIDRGAFKVTLLSDAMLELLPGTEAARQGVRMHRGRAILQPGATGGPERLDFVLQIAGQRWWLHFSGPEAVCAVEVVLREPVGFEQAYNGDGHHAALFVTAGSVRVDVESGESQTLAAGQQRVLTALPWPGASTAGVPAWIDPVKRQTGDTLRRFGARFEKQFDATSPVELSMPAVAKDPHPKLAELAARCLSVMESSAALMQTLAQTEHEEARAAAAQGLRLWLGQDKDRGPLLQQELTMLYQAEDAAIVYRLLWGIAPAEARDKIVSLQLVEWLRSNHVEIRELAFQQLVQLTGRKYDYRPLGSPSQREPAIQRWLAHLDREGGALVRGE
jgi:hypothetical protein